MRTRTVILISAALMLGSPCASGQSFLDGLKTLGKKAGQAAVEKAKQKATEKVMEETGKAVGKVVDAATDKDRTGDESSSTRSDRQKSGKSVKQTGERSAGNSSRDEELESRYEAMLGPDAGENAEIRDEQVADVPQKHTALLAPLGYPVDASWGVLKAEPVLPPQSEAKQVDWVNKQPNIYALDNQSLVAEYQLLEQCHEDGWFGNLSPAAHRREVVSGELFARIGEINAMVSYLKEPRKLADLLGGDCYKRAIRSSIAPFFNLKGNYIKEETRAYFAAFGGYENAVNESLTEWNPYSDRKTVRTSVPGQTGVVLDDVKAGATVDIDGVQYILHEGDGGRNCRVFVSEVAATAVAGKNLVIPDYIYYNGRKFPVRTMRGGLFYGTAIKSVKLPETLTEISNAVFRGTPITEIVIPASVKKLQGSVFQDCTKLAKVTFEGDYMEEFSGSFQNCTSLRSIVCPCRVDRISYDMFTGCSNLTEVILPENLKEIPSSMFAGCGKLTKIDIPATVTKIGMCAFDGCGVTELDLRNVTEFESFCFKNCKALKKVILNSSLKEDFLMETYSEFMECPLLQVKYENNQYIIPSGFVFVP